MAKPFSEHVPVQNLFTPLGFCTFIQVCEVPQIRKVLSNQLFPVSVFPFLYEHLNAGAQEHLRNCFTISSLKMMVLMFAYAIGYC